ncbi:hypothetical protein EDB84DRAFT_1441597 [Lactarius hengduanensis]|nr:hypothetical protein EDB84DRAFT_1441597 [Lactarius hengduanensis]
MIPQMGRPHLRRRSHRLRLHHSYRSLRGKSAVSVVGGTPLEISSNNSTGGKMDFTKKSGYNLLVCNTAVVLRFFLGKEHKKPRKIQQQKDKEPEAKGKARVADHSSWLLLANLPVF